MRYYPVLLDIKDKPCCVVGGGGVAERKAKTLIAAGAKVTVISPRFSPGIARLVAAGRVAGVRRPFSASMLRGFHLVIAATDDRGVNGRVSAAAIRRRAPVNVVDDPCLSSFIVPSVISRNGLIISISTSGKVPCLSRKIRLDLERTVVPGYVAELSAVAAERRRLRHREPDIAKRKKSLARFLRTRKGACSR